MCQKYPKHCDRLWDACDECTEEAYQAWRKAEDEREAKKAQETSVRVIRSKPFTDSVGTYSTL